MHQKSLSLLDCEIKLEGESGRFAGYASKFGGVDNGGDTIMKGAYAQTLREHGSPKMFVQHDAKSLPVGKWISAVEDDHGLHVEGEFTPGMPRADEARAALKHGTVDGLSIGYLLHKSDYEEKGSGRIIRSISRLVEISLVTFPMDTGARVDLNSVKSEDIEQIDNIRDFERLIRDVGGFDQWTAKKLVTKARELLTQRDVGNDHEEAVNEMLMAMQKTQSEASGRQFR